MSKFLKDIGAAPYEKCAACGRMSDYMRRSKRFGIVEPHCSNCYMPALDAAWKKLKEERAAQ